MPSSPSVVTIIIMVERCLQTSVWILKGLEIESGILSLASDRLRLEALERVVFDVALAEAAVIFPRIQFDRGCRVTIGTSVHKLAFVRPDDTLGESEAGLAEGRRWREQFDLLGK